MAYYVINSMPNAEPKSYRMTTDCDKPRAVINGSYIPLTTKGGDGVRVRPKGATTTYRLMEYKSTSGASLETFYTFSGISSRSVEYSTTDLNSEGMSYVTDLVSRNTGTCTTTGLYDQMTYQ